MREVIQGNNISIDVWFYNIDPSAGGVPTDPDNYLHTWDVLNDAFSRVSAISLLQGGVWPAQNEFYFSIEDDGAEVTINGYSDAGRTNLIVSTGLLPYGVFTQQALNEVAGSGYSGAISFTFPGIGGGTEDFEIEDAGATEPTYLIKNENNATVLSSTLFPTRLEVGHYQTSYAVAVDAVPGQNWRLIARATINGLDTFVSVPFRVVDAADAVDEAARLVTLSEVKAVMEISDDMKDDAIDSLILPASQAIEEYCMQLFHVESKVGYFDGNGADRIFVDIPGPIYSIEKLEYSVNGNRNWNEVNVENYLPDGFFITMFGGMIFFDGLNNWKITYMAGRDRAPAQVKKAVCELIRFWWDGRNRLGIKADVVGGGLRVIYEDIKKELPDKIAQMLNRYRRLG